MTNPNLNIARRAALLLVATLSIAFAIACDPANNSNTPATSTPSPAAPSSTTAPVTTPTPAATPSPVSSPPTKAKEKSSK